LAKVNATIAFLALCESNGWQQTAVDTTPEMPADSFRWLCKPSGWRATQVDVRAFFNDDAMLTRFELHGRSKDAERIASALRNA
jgi:hypothetical protein